MVDIKTISDLKEVVDIGNEMISSINHHPAIIDSVIMKKGEIGMDMERGDLLDQIDTANKFVAELDDTIKQIYSSVKRSYSQRFPEFNVSDPMQYILTAQLLGNDPSMITDDKIKSQLNEVLEPKMHLLITMTAATTQGVKLEPDEMKYILKACSVAVHLTNLRGKLLMFVESNMATIAPSLSVVVGAPIAAKLMGLAGGLTQLATMPACNVAVLGSHKVSSIETDVSTPPPRTGLIYDCDLIQKIPFENAKEVRKRAVRWVANKCVLAARCDASKSDLSGSAGRLFRDKIQTLIDKELEPPPKKAPRPLPKPIEKSGKRRGGKRNRRTNERYAQTELRKAANRMNFGDVGDDAYQDDLGFERSQLNAMRKLHGPRINEKTKIRLSKKAQKRLDQASTSTKSTSNGSGGSGGGGGGGGGEGQNMVDGGKGKKPEGIVFTPQTQGLKIYNPKAKESYTAGTSGESSNYFSNTAGFLKIKKSEEN